MSNSMHLVAGLDIGNGYVKGLIRNQDRKHSIDSIDMPSGVAVMTRPNSLPDADDRAADIVGGDFYNQLDVSFTSSMVPDAWRRLFGVRGLSAGGSFDEFDVIGRRSKAEQPLSKVLVLGCFAAKAVRDHVQEHGVLPDADSVLAVQAVAVLALPITEYMSHRVGYAAEFTAKTHTVTVHNFETPVTVKITFANVQVVAEGQSAQYAITNKGEALMEPMLADVRHRGLTLPDITAADVLAANSTVSIDIGEGTVNFPVFTQGKFNPDASTTFSKGYGSVLTDALKSMEDQGFSSGFSSRKQLAEYLNAEPSALKKNFYHRVSDFVHEEIVFFCREVAEQLGRVLSVVGATTEVVYVYGGGSGPIKDVLYPILLNKVTEMNSSDAAPVLYLDSSYSRHLNREGLFLLADRLAG